MIIHKKRAEKADMCITGPNQSALTIFYHPNYHLCAFTTVLQGQGIQQSGMCWEELSREYIDISGEKFKSMSLII